MHTGNGCHWRLCPPVRGSRHGQASCPWHPRSSSTHSFKMDTLVGCALRTDKMVHEMHPTKRALFLSPTIYRRVLLRQHTSLSPLSYLDRGRLILAGLLKVRHHIFREQLHRVEDGFLWHTAPVKHDQQMGHAGGMIFLHLRHTPLRIAEN